MRFIAIIRNLKERFVTQPSQIQDKCFRETIENLHEQYGIATQSRIAHLAVRFYKSRQKEGSFYNGSVFSAVADMCKDENVDDRTKFLKFVKEELKTIVSSVCEAGKKRLTQWHLTRYATERNGDIFLFLMLVHQNKLFSGFDIGGIAELLFGYASQTDYAIRKIFDEGLQIGLARLLTETYYNVPRLTLPVRPMVYKGLDAMTLNEVSAWKVAHPNESAFIALGYGGSPHNRSLSVLIYACRNSGLNHEFEYDKQLGVWSEENCPWDYDHIVPHSTIENIDDEAERVSCEWLKNSIGNIAPIPFSINRSLSDSARDSRYPFCRVQFPADGEVQQSALCVDGGEVASMWSDGKFMPEQYVRVAMRRFVKIYSKWYEGLGLDRILNFELGFDQDGSRSLIRKEIVKRYDVLQSVESAIKSAIPDSDCYCVYVKEDGSEAVISEAERRKCFAAENQINLVCEVDGLEMVAGRWRVGGTWKVGLRKKSLVQQKDDAIQSQVEKVFGEGKIGNGETVTIRKDDRAWYLCDEISDCDDAKEGIERRMKTLISIWQNKRMPVAGL